MASTRKGWAPHSGSIARLHQQLHRQLLRIWYSNGLTALPMVAYTSSTTHRLKHRHMPTLAWSILGHLALLATLTPFDLQRDVLGSALTHSHHMERRRAMMLAWSVGYRRMLGCRPMLPTGMRRLMMLVCLTIDSVDMDKELSQTRRHRSRWAQDNIRSAGTMAIKVVMTLHGDRVLDISCSTSRDLGRISITGLQLVGGRRILGILARVVDSSKVALMMGAEESEAAVTPGMESMTWLLVGADLRRLPQPTPRMLPLSALWRRMF